MRAFARFAALSALASLIAPFASAQRPGGTTAAGRHVIEGNVTNEADRSPMFNIAVRLSTQTGQIVGTSYTAANGSYSFTDLGGAEYVLSIKADGFEEVKQDARLITIPNLTVNISLRRLPGPKQVLSTSGDAVSARELGLPPKAQDALAKGRERLYQKHDPAGSVPYFQKVVELSPGFYEAYYQQGVAYTLEGHESEAESAFRKAIDVSEHRYAEPCFALASLLTDEKKFSDAEQVDREGLHADPEAWRGYYELARALLGEGNPADAEKNGMEARKRKADFPGLYLVLANIHMQLHNNEAVLDDVNAFLKLEPDGPASGQARSIKSQMERALGRAAGTPE